MPAAVDADTFTSDEIAVDQEEHRFGDFRGTAPSPKRCGFDHLHASTTRRGVIGQSFKIVRCRHWWPQANSPHYLMCLDGLLTANKVAREFEFTPLRQTVLQFSDIPENQSKSARVRAICNHAWTRRTPSAARIRRIQQNLSGRDLARSMDHRRKRGSSVAMHWELSSW